MAARYETGTYYNRGFSGTDPNGFCAKLDNWLTSSPSLGGAGWYSLENYSTVSSSTFTVPDHNNDRCYCVGHGLFTGQELSVGTSTTLPTGLSANTTYFVIQVDADNVMLASTLSNALSSTQINISSAGSGTHTLYRSPFKVYCNVPLPLINQAVKFIRVLYNYNITATGFTNAIRIMECLWWDSTNHIPRGVWNQYYLSIRASTNDDYFFLGNNQNISIVSKNDTTYNQYITGTWVGDSNIIQPITSIGVLQVGVTAGSSVVCTLASGQAANFSVNKYYFIHDFNGHSWVDYARCTVVDTLSNTITLQTLNYSFPAGAVIGAYVHRFYAMSTNVITTGSTGNSDNVSYSRSTIPYISSTSGTTSNIFHNQTGLIRVSCIVSYYSTAVTGGDPEDDGYYYAQVPIISEYHRGDGTLDTVGLRILGKVGTGDLYVTSITGLSRGLTLRTVNGVNCRYYNRTDEIFTSGGDSATVVLVQAQST